MTRPVWCGRRIDKLNLRGCQVSHKQEQERVRGHVKVEIDQAMHEEAGASHQTGELQGPGKGVAELAHSLQRFAEQNTEEPRTTEPSENAGFGESLEVVVVRVIDDLPIVE